MSYHFTMEAADELLFVVSEAGRTDRARLECSLSLGAFIWGAEGSEKDRGFWKGERSPVGYISPCTLSAETEVWIGGRAIHQLDDAGQAPQSL